MLGRTGALFLWVLMCRVPIDDLCELYFIHFFAFFQYLVLELSSNPAFSTLVDIFFFILGVQNMLRILLKMALKRVLK